MLSNTTSPHILNPVNEDNKGSINNQNFIPVDSSLTAGIHEGIKALETREKSIKSDNLHKVLGFQETIRELKAKKITFSNPILRQELYAVLYPHTINIIQGQAGAHKSRLAEIICSALLAKLTCKEILLNFRKDDTSKKYSVLYVDTERNIREQLPYALQSIQMKAGYLIDEHPSSFDYISLLPIRRTERFNTLQDYIREKYLKQSIDDTLMIVLDVSTDCIEDFNKVGESMELIDLMNNMINDYDVLFLCLIHENPKSEKARGHFGTELMNKASTVLQVGFEKDACQNDTEIIRVKYLKCRSTAKHNPFYIKYSNEFKGLVLADASEVSGVINSRKQKAINDDVADKIEDYLNDRKELSRNELLKLLTIEFSASNRTIESRIADIMEAEKDFTNTEGQQCRLAKETKNKTTFYKLQPAINKE